MKNWINCWKAKINYKYLVVSFILHTFAQKGTNMRNKPVIGTKYGNYEVISDVIGVKNRKTYYLVKCSCDREQYVRADILKSGNAKSCKFCHNKKNYDKNIELGLMNHLGYTTGKHQGVGDLTKTHLFRIKQNAKIRSIEWSEDLTITYLWELFLKQNRKCALSGLDISLKKDIHTPTNNPKHNIDYTTFTASLDRIDSSKPYTKENVQWVHRNINIMKNSYNQDYFIDLCSKVINHANQQPS